MRHLTLDPGVDDEHGGHVEGRMREDREPDAARGEQDGAEDQAVERRLLRARPALIVKVE